MTNTTPPPLPTCWAIVSGEYSDYKVHAIFSTEKQAYEEMDSWGGEYVQEFPFNDFLPKPPKGMKAWGVVRPPNPNSEIHASDGWGAEYIRKHGDDVVAMCRTHLWARDKEHAIKIASERFFQYDAQQAGIA